MSGAAPFVDAATVAAHLDYPSLIAALRRAFLDPPLAPERLSLPIAQSPAAPGGTFLVMPAVRPGGLITCKLVTVHPALGRRPGGALRSTLVALDAATGALRGLVDGHALTNRRTAAASALAAQALARPAASRLLVLGAGGVAAELARAYAAVFRLDRIDVWARRIEASRTLAEELRAEGLPAEAAPDLSAAVRGADIVSAATLSRSPLVLSEDVSPGAHVDLVGGFTPDMREADDALIARAIVVADGPGASTAAGDLVQPLARGVIAREAVRELAAVLRDGFERPPAAVTLFKSVGLALEDLAAAELLFERLDAAATGLGRLRA